MTSEGYVSAGGGEHVPDEKGSPLDWETAHLYPQRVGNSL